ncbi:hypothetical protein T07_4240 [Trichinella nelsoni]|uniref:Uncharacterized protein n=1 Tax=Trichinella nelsoni TaxID=6336 RepID=A0A0V0RQ08_9BILA|nr:hypothetical protein T07_4240 [Trichinella nelsoni]
MARPQPLEEACRIAERAMNHIVYITGGCDTTPNPEYPLEDAGIKAAERQRRTRKDKSIESWPPGASGQLQLINGATGGQAVCRDPEAGCISRGHTPVVKSGQMKAVYRALKMARDREEPHGTVRKRCRPGKKQRRASLGRESQGGALHEFQNLSIILNSVFI